MCGATYQRHAPADQATVAPMRPRVIGLAAAVAVAACARGVRRELVQDELNGIDDEHRDDNHRRRHVLGRAGVTERAQL